MLEEPAGSGTHAAVQAGLKTRLIAYVVCHTNAIGLCFGCEYLQLFGGIALGVKGNKAEGHPGRYRGLCLPVKDQAQRCLGCL